MLRHLFIVLCLFSSFHPAFAQDHDFDRWFEEGVMRLDLIFSGTADESTYAFTALKKEAYFSGSRRTLVDPFDYGDHKFEVRDAETGTLIYSLTYCTLFKEWQTTTEAKSFRRAYNHVIRFPWPSCGSRVTP